MEAHARATAAEDPARARRLDRQASRPPRVARAVAQAAHHARRGRRLRRLRRQRRHQAASPAAVIRRALVCVLAGLWTHTAFAAPTRDVRDDTGERVAVPAKGCRIISLAPGATAMLYAAGGADCMVGTIAHSDEPVAAGKLPIVGDAETFDFERMLSLRPTAVVSAVDVVQPARLDRIRSLGIPIYQVHVTSLAAMPESLRRLGALTGTQPVADREAVALAAEL